MSNLSDRAFISLSELLNSNLPSFLPEFNNSNITENIWVEPLEVKYDGDELKAKANFFFEETIQLNLPGIDAFSILIAEEHSGTLFSIEIQILPELEIRLNQLPITIHFNKNYFRPVQRIENADGTDSFVKDDSVEHVQINLGEVEIILNSETGIELQISDGIDLPLCMIGDSGIVIEAKSIEFFLSDNDNLGGIYNGQKGIFLSSLSLFLPENLSMELGAFSAENCFIGNGGFTGSLSHSWPGSLNTTFFDLSASFHQLDIAIVQNSITSFSLSGSLTVPYFGEDVGVHISLDISGSFLIELTNESGIQELTIPHVLTIELTSLGFAIKNSKIELQLSGNLIPNFGADGLNWPTFEIDRLSIDSDGQIHLDGGWLDLPSQYSLDFYGFRFEISQLGFGRNDDGSKWVGFSGGIHLVAGLPAGVSVEGLRITWFDNGSPRISFDGIAVELEVPNAFQFKGKVSYKELEDGTRRFDGDILFSITSINLVIDAQLVIGTAPDGSGRRYNFMAIYLGVDLPVGIPLANSGLAIYGFAGLFALQMEPDKQEGEAWYGIGDEGWYKRPEVGVTDLAQKWVNEQGSLALGAGITLGTVYDNGFSFNGRLLFAIVFPGPIILLEGRANILKARAKLSDEAAFKAISVLDLKENTFTAGLDAEYKYASGGRLMLMNASAEVFFSFNDPSAWHLYLGMKEPREKRIRARSFDLFETNSYFMLDPRSVAYGLWVGYDWNKKFGPVRLIFEAWIEGNVALSFRPPQFYGDIHAHGKIGVAVWRFRFSLGGDIRLATTVFDPFWLKGELEVKIDLPRPLPDFNPKIKLEWGPEKERPNITPPPNPNDPDRPASGPLKEIAAEHFKVPSTWTLELRGEDEGAPTEIPVVPLDVRPHIAFRESVKDANLIGVNSTSPEPPNVIIGDPISGEGSLQVEYSLTDVALEKREDGSYKVIASVQQGVGDIFGSWAPIPDIATDENITGSANSNTKLWIWSKSPFEYFRHNQLSWLDWHRRHHDTLYPCPPRLLDEVICFDFEEDEVFDVFKSNYRHPEEAAFAVFWSPEEFRWVENLPVPFGGLQKGLVLSKFSIPSWSNEFTIVIPAPFYKVQIYFQFSFTDTTGLRRVTFSAHSLANEVLDEEVLNFSEPVFIENANRVITLMTSENEIRIIRISSNFSHSFQWSLVRVCCFAKASKQEGERLDEIRENLQESIERWSGEENILEPHSNYRLRVVTRQISSGIGRFEEDFEEIEEKFINYVYFRTEGPPGLAQLAQPTNTTEESEGSLSDLRLYVERTIPSTTLSEGEKPELPRPVYRAYDLGVEFNESYVDLMYKIANRGLHIYLFNSNNQPVRDAEGKLIVLNNYLGSSIGPSITLAEQTYLEVLSNSKCLDFDLDTIPLDEKLMAIHPEQVLDPDTVYEARLIPLLFEEGFQENLNDWEVITAGTNSAPANWERVSHKKYFGSSISIVENEVFLADMGATFASDLHARFDIIYIEEDNNENRPNKTYRILEVNTVTSTLTLDGIPNTPTNTYWEIPALGAIVQNSNVWGGQNNNAGIRKPGTLYILTDLPNRPQGPTNWSDYRYSVVVHPDDNDGIGVVFRYNNGNYYRFSMDAERSFRRLVKFRNNEVSLLAEDSVAFETNQDYLITVEAIQTSIRIYLNGELLF